MPKFTVITGSKVNIDPQYDQRPAPLCRLPRESILTPISDTILVRDMAANLGKSQLPPCRPANTDHAKK